MTKYYWDDEDFDDDDENSMSDEEYYIIAHKINGKTLTDGFLDIVQQNKKLFETKLKDPAFEAKQIQKEIDKQQKSREMQDKRLTLVAQLKGIVKNYYQQKKKNSYDAYQKLQQDMDSNDRSIAKYETNNWTNDKIYKQLLKERKVLETLAKMKSVEDVERYLDKYEKQYQKSIKTLGEIDANILELEQKKTELEQEKSTNELNVELKKQREDYEISKKTFIVDFRNFFRVYPNDPFVEKMKKMITDAYFEYDYKMPYDIVDQSNLERVVTGINNKSLINLCKNEKDTDDGR